MLTNWVNAGGNLIAMRPDKQLAGLLGLTRRRRDARRTPTCWSTPRPARAPASSARRCSSTAPPTATRSPARTRVATLYSDATTADRQPGGDAAQRRRHGGQAAAFTYDLARSVVYTRQGNPAWAGQERDGIAPIRSDDLFFGASAGDPQPDWVDLDKVAIPQADEQQRLLANLITQMNLDRKPLPRFWYFPRGTRRRWS